MGGPGGHLLIRHAYRDNRDFMLSGCKNHQHGERHGLDCQCYHLRIWFLQRCCAGRFLHLPEPICHVALCRPGGHLFIRRYAYRDDRDCMFSGCKNHQHGERHGLGSNGACLRIQCLQHPCQRQFLHKPGAIRGRALCRPGGNLYIHSL